MCVCVCVCVCLCVCVYVCVCRSGYDFGYLIKILSNANLPEEEVDFFEILRLYFPVIYDVKYLMKSCKNLKVFKSIFQQVAQHSTLFSVDLQ